MLIKSSSSLSNVPFKIFKKKHDSSPTKFNILRILDRSASLKKNDKSLVIYNLHAFLIEFWIHFKTKYAVYHVSQPN